MVRDTLFPQVAGRTTILGRDGVRGIWNEGCNSTLRGARWLRAHSAVCGGLQPRVKPVARALLSPGVVP